MARLIFVFVVAFLLNSLEAASQVDLKGKMDSVPVKMSIRPLPPNFYNSTTGWFCKKEVQLQKLISAPLFIRLGSKEYVDYLERKPNTFLTPFRR